MFCIKCGNKLIEDAGFCQKCGTRAVVEDTSTQTPDIPASVPEPSQPATHPSPSPAVPQPASEPAPTLARPSSEVPRPAPATETVQESQYTPVSTPEALQESRQIAAPTVATPVNSRKKWIIIGGAAVVLVAAAVIIFVLVLLPIINRNRIRAVEPTHQINGAWWGEVGGGDVGISISTAWSYRIEPQNWNGGHGHLITILDTREAHIVTVIIGPSHEIGRRYLASGNLPEHMSFFEFNDGNTGLHDRMNHTWTNGDIEMAIVLALEENALLRRLYNETGGFGAYEEIINSIARNLTDPEQRRAAYSSEVGQHEQLPEAETPPLDTTQTEDDGRYVYHPRDEVRASEVRYINGIDPSLWMLATEAVIRHAWGEPDEIYDYWSDEGFGTRQLQYSLDNYGNRVSFIFSLGTMPIEFVLTIFIGNPYHPLIFDIEDNERYLTLPDVRSLFTVVSEEYAYLGEMYAYIVTAQGQNFDFHFFFESQNTTQPTGTVMIFLPSIPQSNEDGSNVHSYNELSTASDTVSGLHEIFMLYWADKLRDERIIPYHIEVIKEENYLRIVIAGDMLFHAGQTTLLSAAQDVIIQFGPVLSTFAAQGHEIIVENHTDNVPNPTGNVQLSADRATAVTDFLIANTDLTSASITPAGMGEYFPLNDNATPEDRARNRRVEIKIFIREEGI